MLIVASFATEARVWRSIVAVGAVLVVVVALRDDRKRILVDAKEQARAFALADEWFAESRALRCPRPALRSPISANGPPLDGLIAMKSDEADCLRAVSVLREELQPRCGGASQYRCPMTKLEAMRPHPDVVARCAPVYDLIERNAHASEACSPMRASDASSMPDGIWFVSLDSAIRIKIAPLVVRGELAQAARHVTDAIRLADDLGRGTYLVGTMISTAAIVRLSSTLDEILTDPRLTADDARAIARDLDVLLATRPTMVESMREEVIAVTAMARTSRWPITGDIDQDRALTILGLERWLRDFARACSAATLRECADRIDEHERRASAALNHHYYDEADFQRELNSWHDDATVRERLIDMLSLRALIGHYVRGFAAADLPLRAARMQAEMRMMSSDECRDPERRQRRLAPLQADMIVLGTMVLPPAWTVGGFPTKRSPRFLRCID